MLLIGARTRSYGVGALAVLVVGAASSFVAAGMPALAVPTLALLGLLVVLAYVSARQARLIE